MTRDEMERAAGWFGGSASLPRACSLDECARLLSAILAPTRVTAQEAEAFVEWFNVRQNTRRNYRG